MPRAALRLHRLTGLLAGLGIAVGAWAQSGAGQSVAPAASVAPLRTSISELNLPDIGEPADEVLTPAQEAEVGGQVVAQMYYYDFVLDDPEIADYLNSLGYRLAASSAGNAAPKIDVFMVKDPRINAFALPGGYMGINAGLVTAAANESELAGVMGHELAHITQRHIARGANTGASWEGLAALGVMIAAVLSGSANPDLIIGSLAIGQSLAYQRQVAYTRSHEEEADRIGIQTMSAAGFDPHGMAAFFQRLEQQSRLYGTGVPEILRTHPLNTNRIAEAEARAAALPPAHNPASIEFGLMRARTRVMIADRPASAIDAFESEIRSGRDTLDAHYGIALALFQTGQYDRARTELKGLLERYPRQINLNLLLAEIDANSGHASDALKRYAQLVDQSPRSAPVLLSYGEALIVAGKPAEARSLLLTHDQAYGTRTETYRLLGRAAEAMHNPAEASYQMANFHYERGDYGSALAQLDAGLRIASISTQDRAKLAARRAEVRAALPRNFNPDGREP